MGADEIDFQAALQWGLMRLLFRLLFSGAEELAVQAALQWGLMKLLFRLKRLLFRLLFSRG